MTKERYLEMCKVMGDEPDIEKMPPEFSDFPDYVHTAFFIYNELPNTFTGGMDPIFSGKDFASLNIMFDLFNVPHEDRRMTFDIISHINTRAIKDAFKKAEAARKKAGK